MNPLLGAAEVPRVQQKTPWSCGPASLRAVLAAYGDVRTERELNIICKCSRGSGTSEADLVRGARSLGYGAYSHLFENPAELRKMTRRGIPVICVVVSWNIPGAFHWIVVEGAEDGLVRIVDPHPPAGKDNRRTLLEDAFDSRWWHREGFWFLTRKVPRLGVIIEPKGMR